MKIALIAITDSSLASAKRLQRRLPGSELVDVRGKGNLRAWAAAHFQEYDGLVFFMAIGIVYRVIAGQITSKYEDPAVVVVDDACRYAISALSGHEGGANDLAWTVGILLGAQPVITTATETRKQYVVGIGCRLGVSPSEVRAAVTESLEALGITASEVRVCASAWLKREEEGLVTACGQMGLPILFVPEYRLKRFTGAATISEAALRRFGIEGVAEPCALITAKRGTLALERRVCGNVTVAIVKEELD